MLWSSVKLYCAAIVVYHQHKSKQLWKLPYSWQLKYNKAENVVALPPDQNLVCGLLATVFVILKLLLHIFVPPSFQHLNLEPSSPGFLLSRVPKCQIFLLHNSFIFESPNPELQASFIFSCNLLLALFLPYLPLHSATQVLILVKNIDTGCSH